MARRGLRWRGFSVQVEVPEAVASRIRRGSTSVADDRPGRLRLDDRPRELHVRPRDAKAALAFRDVAEEEGHRHALDTGWTGGDELAERVRSVSWYHTIELPDGRRTPGQFDHHELLPHYGLPT